MAENAIFVNGIVHKIGTQLLLVTIRNSNALIERTELKLCD